MTRSFWTTRSHTFAGCIQSGTHFPNGWGFGKCVQEFAFGVGCSFQLRALAENATRNLRSEWDGVSQRGRKRKLHPIPDMGLRTRFPDAKRPHDVAFNLYMFSRCPHDKPRFNTEASARPARNVRFIASSARAGEHLMCSPCEQDCPSREPYVPRRRADEPVKTRRYLILVVPGARLGSVSLASVWKCSVYTFLPSRNIS